MILTNLSAEPLGKLYSWVPPNLKAEEIVFFPDACPGKSPLPTGTSVSTSQPDWRRFAVSDCGCGMRLLRSELPISELKRDKWNQLADILRSQKGMLGDLGGGNHFLDAIQPYGNDHIYFLIHTGSRDESGLVDDLVNQPERFDTEFSRIVEWAENNRARIHENIEEVFGPAELVLDKPHNTFEKQNSGTALIRKGSVKVEPGDLAVIPSHMSGDVVLVQATDAVADVLFSLSHGTGRIMSRSECKPLANSFNFHELRKHVLMPEGVQDASLRTEGPYAYRDLDECLLLLDGYVEEVMRFQVKAYMGHL